MAEKAKNNENLSKVLILCALAALIIAGAVLLLKSGKRFGKRADFTGSVPADSVMMRNLAGTYDVSFSNYDTLDATSAEILPASEDEYELVTISEYGPRTYLIKIQGTTLHSDVLGEGSVEYKKSVDKTTITFNKGGETCTLTK